MIRALLAIPFLAIAWGFLKVGEAFSHVATLVNPDLREPVGHDAGDHSACDAWNCSVADHRDRMIQEAGGRG